MIENGKILWDFGITTVAVSNWLEVVVFMKGALVLCPADTDVLDKKIKRKSGSSG